MKYASLLLVLPLASACRIPNAPERPALDVALPEQWSAAPATGQTEVAERFAWWNEFGDPDLSAVIEQALSANHDLRAALQRVEAARAIARIAGADGLPSVGLGASGARNQQVFVGLPIPGGPDVLTSRSTSFGVSLDVSWELDLWGKLQARERAAAQDFQASADEFEAARHSLAAQTAKTYLAWQEARLQRDLAQRTVDSFGRSADIAQNRFENGRTSALDVRASDSDAARAHALLEQREAQVEVVVRQLEILLGRYPAGTLAAAPRLPDLPAPPPAGLPSELLQQRPDLRAADARLAATHARLFEARAAFYPSISLTGSVGRVSSELGDLLDSDFDVWSIAAGLFQPLFQGGRLEAGAELARANMLEAAERYSATVLAAFADVERVLATEDNLERRASFQLQAFEDANAASSLAEERYSSGLEDLTVLLAAQRRALDAETAWIGVRRERLDERVDLYLALGGSLTTPDRTETPQAVAPAED